MTTLIRSVRYGLRGLLRSPGWTLTAVLTLALGIAANTTVFSCVEAVLLRPFPYAEPGGLVGIWLAKTPTAARGPSTGMFDHWRREALTFEQMAPFLDESEASIDSEDAIPAGLVGFNALEILGVTPVLGRAFAASDAEPGARKTVVLSYGLWQTRFGGDTGIVGTSTRINGELHAILGVMPPEFFFPNPTIRLWTLVPGTISGLPLVARLRDNVQIDQAQAEIEALSRQYLTATSQGTDVLPAVIPLQEVITEDSKTALWTLFGAVWLVLLIACANVANLLLSRGILREKELAIRTSVGATRWTLASELFTENLILGIMGGVVGLLFASWGIRLVSSVNLTAIPRLSEAMITVDVMVFLVATAVLTPLIFGLLPALKVSRSNPIASLKLGGTTSDHASVSTVRDMLVVIEVALAIILLIGATLLVGSFARQANFNLGVDARNLIVVEPQMPGGLQLPLRTGFEFSAASVRRLASIPIVKDAAVGVGVPIRWGFWSSKLLLVDGELIGAEDWKAGRFMVGDGYFRTMGVPILQGREFTEGDTETSSKVVIVSKMLANRLWPGENAIGKQFSILQMNDAKADELQKRMREGGDLPSDPSFLMQLLEPAEDTPREVVGVVGDIKWFGLHPVDSPPFYVHYRQDPDPQAFLHSATFVIKTDGALESIVDTVKQAITEIAGQTPGVEISGWRISTMEDIASEAVGGRGSNRLLSLVSASYAGVALLLALGGIYSVILHTVHLRRYEIAIRVALGATRPDIFTLVLSRGVYLSVLGLALGITGAWASTRFVEAFLFEVTPTDPLTFAAVSAAVLLVSAAASVVPALHATRIDPISASK